MPGYTYETRDLVYKFNGPDGQLSNGMKAIFDSIKAIAIDDLTEEKFREFYEQNFIMGDFTDIKEGDEKVGFLYATFYHNPNGKPQYTAKAFQAVTKEKRQIGKPFDRSQLYKKFIIFYLQEILLLQLVKNAGPEGQQNTRNSWLRRGRDPGFSDILYAAGGANESANRREYLQIEIFAENPTTYYDICSYGLRHKSVKPEEDELNWLENLTAQELLNESFLLSEEYDAHKKERPEYLEKTSFTVNISPREWRNSFKTTKREKKFYIWQNYQFPDYAFKVIIPVDLENILNALFRIVEIKGKNAVKTFLAKIREEITNNTGENYNELIANIIKTQGQQIEGLVANLTNFLTKNLDVIPATIKKTIKEVITNLFGKG